MIFLILKLHVNTNSVISHFAFFVTAWYRIEGKQCKVIKSKMCYEGLSKSMNDQSIQDPSSNIDEKAITEGNEQNIKFEEKFGA